MRHLCPVRDYLKWQASLVECNFSKPASDLPEVCSRTPNFQITQSIVAAQVVLQLSVAQIEFKAFKGIGEPDSCLNGPIVVAGSKIALVMK